MIRPAAKSVILEVPRKVCGIWFWYRPPSRLSILTQRMGLIAWIALMSIGISFSLLFDA